MAAIVVVGVVVTNDDDSDFTRNRALRRGAESTSTSSMIRLLLLLVLQLNQEVRNQSDVTSLRSESSGTVETATRLNGGNELKTADCCDQNAYEILKLQNKLESLETEVGELQNRSEKDYEVFAGQNHRTPRGILVLETSRRVKKTGRWSIIAHIWST